MNYSNLYLVLILISFSHDVLTCLQAWDGGGTGAWYRVDTSCLYPFSMTTLIQCLPDISMPPNATRVTDGFYISLGVFNRFNGAGLDIGLTYDLQTNKWWSYANDLRGWKSGNISIDSSVNRCLNISLSTTNGEVDYFVRVENGSTLLGQDTYLASQLDPQLNLTVNSSSLGFYRFDSIAQTKETLKTGSQMIHARLMRWFVSFNDRQLYPARGQLMASSIRGYAPGSCCTKEEISTISVYSESQWDEADISISYI